MNYSKEEIERFNSGMNVLKCRTILYALLSKEPVQSLHDIIHLIEHNDAAGRLAKGIGLEAPLLRIIVQKSNPNILLLWNQTVRVNSSLIDENITVDEVVELLKKKLSGYPGGATIDEDCIKPLAASALKISQNMESHYGIVMAEK